MPRRDPSRDKPSKNWWTAKRRLRSVINKSKSRGWQNLVNDANDDPWGLGYKLVTRKIGALWRHCILRELEGAVLTMKNKKAPGPDGIPAEVYKLVFRQRAERLKQFNACLKEGISPCRWKVARLTLIRKDKGDPELPSA